MTGHEARINNVMDDGKKMIEEGATVLLVFCSSFCHNQRGERNIFITPCGRGQTSYLIPLSFLKRSFPKR